MLVLTVA